MENGGNGFRCTVLLYYIYTKRKKADPTMDPSVTFVVVIDYAVYDLKHW